MMSDMVDLDNIKNFEEEIIDDTDTDLFKLKIAKELSEQLFELEEVKNKQVTRLTNKEIALLSMMETIDEILGFKLYEPFARNFRLHKISLGGLSRKEIVDLVKAISSPSGEYGSFNSGDGENRGFFSRIKQRLFN